MKLQVHSILLKTRRLGPAKNHTISSITLYPVLELGRQWLQKWSCYRHCLVEVGGYGALFKDLQERNMGVALDFEYYSWFLFPIFWPNTFSEGDTSGWLLGQV